MKCQFPECEEPGFKAFASIQLCRSHHEKVENETDRFYSSEDSKKEAEQRPLYFKIHLLIPWSKQNIKEGRPKRVQPKKSRAKRSECN